MPKSSLEDLSNQLQAVYEQIVALSINNRSLMSMDDEYKEAFGATLDNFEPKLATFRRKIAKIARHAP